MTLIIVACPAHGPQTVDSRLFTLNPCRTGSRLSFYTFPCGTCGTVRKPADLHITAVLVGADVRPAYWSVPAEALEEHAGPPLVLDDLITLHFELDALNRSALGAA